MYQEPIIGGFNQLDSNTKLYEWMNKYREDFLTFIKYVENCSLEEFVYLFVIAFKEKYPNFSNLKNSFYDGSTGETMEIHHFESNFERNDISELIVNMYMAQLRMNMIQETEKCTNKNLY